MNNSRSNTMEEDNTTEQKNPKVKSLYKALKVFDCFDMECSEWSLSDLAKETGMLVSSMHNILSTFEMCGLVYKNPKTHKFSIGQEVLRLSNIYLRKNSFVKILHQKMDMLAEQTGENIFFAVPKDTNVLYIEASTPAASMQSISISGVTAPMYCTGIGKAMLAESGETVIHDAISKPLVSYTQYTIVAPEQLLEELETVRKNGYAIDNMEHEFGVKCVGVPIIKKKKLVGGL